MIFLTKVLNFLLIHFANTYEVFIVCLTLLYTHYPTKLSNLPKYTRNQDLNPGLYNSRVCLTHAKQFPFILLTSVKLSNTVPDSSWTLRGGLNPKFNSYYGGDTSLLQNKNE